MRRLRARRRPRPAAPASPARPRAPSSAPVDRRHQRSNGGRGWFPIVPPAALPVSHRAERLLEVLTDSPRPWEGRELPNFCVHLLGVFCPPKRRVMPPPRQELSSIAPTTSSSARRFQAPQGLRMTVSKTERNTDLRANRPCPRGPLPDRDVDGPPVVPRVFPLRGEGGLVSGFSAQLGDELLSVGSALLRLLRKGGEGDAPLPTVSA